MAPTKRAVSSDSDADDDDVNVASQLLNGTPGGTATATGGSAAKRPRYSGDDVHDNDQDARDRSASPIIAAFDGTGRTNDGRREKEEDEDENFDELATPAPEASRYGRRAVDHDDGDEDAQGGDDMGNGEGESDDEDARALISQGAQTLKHRTKGDVAESGVIEEVILKNFMCHKHLQVRLGPQINFIIGHNGSGKSVIMTGIMIAFGAKAAATGRAKTMADLVTEETSSGSVTLALRNKGQEAFKPDVYGKMIYITRTITRPEGKSSYKIANYLKKKVSTTRDELSAICDHFNIQVENPVNLLTQDNAKVFLHSSKPTDKYQFFLKGTQLAQLTEEYNALWEQMNNIKAIVNTKSDRMKELKDKVKVAQTAWDEIEKAKNVEKKIREYKNELAWVQVIDIEKDLTAKVEAQTKEMERVQKNERKLKEAQGQLEKWEKAVEDAQRAADDDDDEAFESDLADVRAKIKDNAKQQAAIRNEHRTMLTNMERQRATVKRLDEQIEGARKLLDGSNREKLEEARRKLAALDAKVDEAQDRIAEARRKGNEVGREIEEAKSQFDNARAEQGPLRQQIENAQQAIRNLENARRDELSVFGPGTQQVLQAIQTSQWREKPYGPIGREVKLKNGKWGKMVESFFGDTLNGFVVTNSDDRRTLNNIIRRCRARHPVYMMDTSGDFNLDTPDPSRFTTILDLLTFDSEAVRRMLINIAHIETTIVVEHRPDGDEIMKWNKPVETNITACISQDAYRLGGLFGGKRQIALLEWRQPPRLSRDTTEQMRIATESLREGEERLHIVNTRRAQLDRQLTELHSSKRQCDNEASQAAAQIRNLTGKRGALVDDTREEEPPNVRALEEAKAEAEDDMKNIEAQAAGGNEQLAELIARMTPLAHRRTDFEALSNQRDQIRLARNEEITNAARQRVTATAAVTQYKQEITRLQAKVQAAEAAVDTAGEHLQTALDTATAICPRENVVLSGRRRDKLETMINSLEKALQDRERRVGGSSEAIHNRLVDAKRVYDENKQTVDDLKAVLVDMRQAHRLRSDRWTDFRHHIIVRTKMLFDYNLSIRGYTGSLKFDHEGQSLYVRIITSMDGQKSQRSKDVATLSGGEKSFATISLLLSLWEAAGCPIRGLDEFDVFMDPVNRKMATKLLIDAAKASNNTQMILISPHSLNANIDKTGVRVVRVSDPGRAQGTLASEEHAG